MILIWKKYEVNIRSGLLITMKDQENRRISIITYCLFVSCLVLAGGFFEYVSCLMVTVLTGILGICWWRAGKISLPSIVSLIPIAVIPLGYLITCLWGIDRGMAVLGFFKFLPLLLFFLLLTLLGKQKEWLISMLPITGTLMTLFTFLMSLFPVFQEYVLVAGRLSGTFQYPNTYAVFLLVCLIIVSFRRDWKAIIYAGILLFGIYQSGSRTVYVITAGIGLALVLYHKDIRKYTIPCVVLLATGVGILVWRQLGIGANRLGTLSLSASTFLGRLLYFQDAVPMILKHPFGMGYYGYFFVQQEYQTGVYSVLSVHNECLQLMLDIGIIPAVVFFGYLVWSIIRKGQTGRNRFVLIAMLLHVMLDYDFQFLSMLWVLLLFLDTEQKKEYAIRRVGKSGLLIGSFCLIAGAVIFGFSCFCYNNGNYKRAFAWGHYHTMAEVYLMLESEDAEEGYQLADDIISRNTHVYQAYAVLARQQLSQGNVEEFIRLEERALTLAPYENQEYQNYVDALNACCERYVESGNIESAGICLKRMEGVETRLQVLSERTSSLGWKIKDVPEVELPTEYMEMIETWKDVLDE